MRDQIGHGSVNRRAAGAMAAVLLLAAGAAGAGLNGVQPLQMTPKIVNGVDTQALPTVVWVFTPAFCTGTLIGCDTVLTAAHCVCEGDTASTCGTPDPGNMLVYAQHGKNYGVASVAVHPDYSFGQTSDLAVLKLSEPVTGIAPTPINTTGKPALGSTGLVAGFGLTINNGAGSFSDLGIKREGLVTTASCANVPDANHICWNFDAPLGDPGSNSNTCQGDSGGPLFVDFGGGPVVAGVTSGGLSGNCQPVDASFDADVFLGRTWIESAAGADIDNTACGSIPQAFGAGTQVLVGDGELDAETTQAGFVFEMPAGISLARFTLNAEEGLGANDFDLFVNQGGPPTPMDFDCGSTFPAVIPEFCEISAPAAGTWNILVNRFEGEGMFQTTVTLFEEQTGCTPDATTLCLNNNRFRVEVDWDTGTGTGQGQVVPGGTGDSSNLFFFSPNNWEMLIKVLDGCAINDRYWVFFAATTDVGFTVTVTDTQEDEFKVYTNPLGQPANAVTDTSAFATCP